MKILALTDIHGKGIIDFVRLQEIALNEKIDLIIIAGDLTTFGRVNDVKIVLEEIAKVNLPIFYIPGNMDDKNSGEHQFNNVYPLHGRIQEFHGYSFIGIGGSNPTPFRTPYTLSEKEIANLLQKVNTLRNKTLPLILVSHAPPKDSEADIVQESKHVGSESIRSFIESEKPLVVICGHIHESQTISQINSSIIVNPGAARHANAAVIALTNSDSNHIEVESKIISLK
ncbi:MAG: metallophosphoesterase [Candidatus Thorarchaeota archaeon]